MVRKPAAILLCLFLTMTGTAAGATHYMRVDEPELEGAAILIADVYELGHNQMIVAKDREILFMAQDEILASISGLSGNVTALAVGDLTGDYRSELVVGTDNAGAVYFYEYDGHAWKRFGRPQYLWDPVTFLEVHDFNNDGWGDLVVVNDKGEAQILMSWEGELYRFWQSPAGKRVVQLAVSDINGDGFPEVIYTLDSGYVGILQWEDQELVLLWENYPWGSIDSLVVLDDRTLPEWLVVTNQKMIYGWRWDSGEVVLNRHFYAPDIGEIVFYVPDSGLLSFSRKKGASLYNLQSSALKELWNVPDVSGVAVFPNGREYLVKDSDCSYYWLVPSDDEWSIMVNGRDISEQVDLLVRGGSLLCNLVQSGQELGYSVVGDGPWHILGLGNYLTVETGSAAVELDGLKIPLSEPIIEEKGLPYAPLDFFGLLGWSAQIDRARQQINFTDRWGWWL
ncbi:MAG: VCBS repeat-containing protein [Firmicutes bacterium]|nr:VCBS repeat-containing protein [Bacillota bacterium]